MAFFILNSEITIGNFQFSGVNSVRIKRSLFSCLVTAYIKVPSKAVVRKANISNERATGHLFNYRDKVTIKLGYNGELQTEFEGFVKRCDTNLPVEIECEGYIQQLRLHPMENKVYPNTSAKKLLELATKGTDVKVIVADDLPFTKVTLNYDPTAEDVINEIKRCSNNLLNVFFIDDKTLWCGLVYTPMSNAADPFQLGTVNLRIGYNVVNNSLCKRVIEGEPVIIRGVTTKPTGERIQTDSQAKTATRREKAAFNNIGDKPTMSKLVQENQLVVNYQGYEGCINAFLQPYCRPGFLGNVVNKNYPELDGKYMITATDLTFGRYGARRSIEIGPQLGFKGN